MEGKEAIALLADMLQELRGIRQEQHETQIYFSEKITMKKYLLLFLACAITFISCESASERANRQIQEALGKKQNDSIASIQKVKKDSIQKAVKDSVAFVNSRKLGVSYEALTQGLDIIENSDIATTDGTVKTIARGRLFTLETIGSKDNLKEVTLMLMTEREFPSVTDRTLSTVIHKTCPTNADEVLREIDREIIHDSFFVIKPDRFIRIQRTSVLANSFATTFNIRK